LPRDPPDPGIATQLASLCIRCAGPQSRDIVTLPIGAHGPEDYLAAWARGSGRLVVSAWDVSPETPPEDVVAVAHAVKG
jgi:hypothetical protein